MGLLIGLAVLFNGMRALGRVGGEARRITYQVDGTTSMAVVTYRLQDGSTTRPENVSLPWKKTLEFPESEMAILTASNPIQTGVIRCQILLDGRLWKEQKAASASEKVSCGGILP